MGDIYEVIDELRSSIEQRGTESRASVNWRAVRWVLAAAGGIALLVTILIVFFQ